MSADKTSRANTAVIGRSLRIITGLILLAYVTSHLVNMMLGLHSVAWVEQARPYLSGVWTGGVGSPVLMLAIVIHFLLALISIYWRETMNMPAYDMVQLLAGAAITPLLVPHVLGIMATDAIYGDASYDLILRVFWLWQPEEGLRQVLLVGALWIHGCIGLFTWMRTLRSAGRALKWLYPLAVAIPVLALLGFVEAGRQVIIQEQQGVTAVASGSVYESTDTQEVFVPAQPPEEIIKSHKQISRQIIIGAATLMALTLLARYFRIARRRKYMVEVHYASGPVFTANSGPTLLDISRMNDLPHANICRGRGRCGTCSVRVLSSDNPLPEPSALEQATLDRIGADDDVRLACQLHPGAGRMRVERLLSPDFSPHEKREPVPAAEAVQPV